jgi:hypothetical protein
VTRSAGRPQGGHTMATNCAPRPPIDTHVATCASACTAYCGSPAWRADAPNHPGATPTLSYFTRLGPLSYPSDGHSPPPQPLASRPVMGSVALADQCA